MPYQLRIGPNVTQSTTAIINDATETNDGVMTKAMVKQLNNAASNDENCCSKDDVIIYVNSDTGIDTRSGQNPASSVRTLTRAFKLLPATYKKKCRIILAAGTVNSYELQRGPYWLPVPSGPSINASPLAVLCDAKNVYGDLTATGSAGDDLVTVTFAVAVGLDTLRGKFFQVKTGGFAGRRYTIVSNAAGGPGPVTIKVNNYVSILAGDIVAVEDPGATIVPVFNFFQGSISFMSGTIGFKNVKFSDGGIGGNIFADHATIVTEGVQFENLGVGAVHNSFMDFESFPFRWLNGSPDNPFSLARQAAGASFNNCSLSATSTSFMDHAGIIDSSFFFINELSEFALTVGSLSWRNAGLFAGQNSLVNLFSFPHGLIDVGGLQDGIALDSGANANIDNFDISNANGNGVVLTENARAAFFGDDLGEGGTGNGNVGIEVAFTSLVQLINIANTTMTGANGDTEFEFVPANIKNYAALNVADGNGVKGFVDPYLNRIQVF